MDQTLLRIVEKPWRVDGHCLGLFSGQDQVVHFVSSGPRGGEWSLSSVRQSSVTLDEVVIYLGPLLCPHPGCPESISTFAALPYWDGIWLEKTLRNLNLLDLMMRRFHAIASCFATASKQTQSHTTFTTVARPAQVRGGKILLAKAHVENRLHIAVECSYRCEL